MAIGTWALLALPPMAIKDLSICIDLANSVDGTLPLVERCLEAGRTTN